jgi:hypothetical protein
MFTPTEALVGVGVDGLLTGMGTRWSETKGHGKRIQADGVVGLGQLG